MSRGRDGPGINDGRVAGILGTLVEPAPSPRMPEAWSWRGHRPFRFLCFSSFALRPPAPRIPLIYVTVTVTAGKQRADLYIEHSASKILCAIAFGSSIRVRQPCFNPMACPGLPNKWSIKT